MQIGYQHAGWYGYDWIDNDGIPSADHIIPQLQHLKVGDDLPIWKGNNYKVVALETNRFLVWESSSGHDSMTLAPYNWTSPSIIIPQLFADGVDLIAIRQNMLGIKARAEGTGPPAPAIVYTELALWVAAFLGFLVAEAGLVVRRDWVRPLLAVSATGLITVSLLLVKPPLWIDGLVTIGIFVGLWKTYWPTQSLSGKGKDTHGEMRRKEVKQ